MKSVCVVLWQHLMYLLGSNNVKGFRSPYIDFQSAAYFRSSTNYRWTHAPDIQQTSLTFYVSQWLFFCEIFCTDSIGNLFYLGNCSEPCKPCLYAFANIFADKKSPKNNKSQMQLDAPEHEMKWSKYTKSMLFLINFCSSQVSFIAQYFRPMQQ